MAKRRRPWPWPTTARSTTFASCDASSSARASASAPRATPRWCCARTRHGGRSSSSGSTGCSPLPSGTRRSGGCCSPATGPARSRSTTPRPDGLLTFGSEIKALLAGPWVERSSRRAAAARVPHLRLRALARTPSTRGSRRCRRRRPSASTRRRPASGAEYWDAAAPSADGASADAAGEIAAAARAATSGAWSPTCRSARCSPAGSTRRSSSG